MPRIAIRRPAKTAFYLTRPSSPSSVFTHVSKRIYDVGLALRISPNVILVGRFIRTTPSPGPSPGAADFDLHPVLRPASLIGTAPPL
jgi:hypothetical protein